MDVMSKLLKTSLIVAAFVPSLALAQAVGGDKELSLSGTGSSDKDFDNTIFSLDVAFGHYLSDTSEVGIRQNISVNDREGERSEERRVGKEGNSGCKWHLVRGT